MSDYEQKPDTGAAWQQSKEQKLQQHENLSKFDWYKGLSKEEKVEKIDKWGGNILLNTPAGEVRAKLGIREGMNSKGNPQLYIRAWSVEMAEAAPELAAAPETQLDDFDDDIPF